MDKTCDPDVMEKFQIISKSYQAIKADRKNLNSLLTLVDIYETVPFCFYI
jgi:hypothetical protein